MKKKMLIIIVGILIALFTVGGIIFYFFIPPKIQLNGNKTITIALEEKYKDEGIKVIWHNTNITKKLKIKTTNNIDNTKIGNYYIEYKFKYNNQDYKIKRKIKIIDNINPELTLTEPIDTIMCPNDNYQTLGYTALDNYDKDITDKVKITKEEIDSSHYKIIYNVKDSSGNTATKTRNITIEDKEKPVIKLIGKTNRNLLKGYNYKEAGYQVFDNCDGDISNKVTITGQVDTNTVGTYTITYKVKDSYGNEAVAYRKVNVINPDTSKNVIYLTFDDGPSTNITPQILDILKEENVQATFFIVDFGGTKTDIVKRIVNEGHTIAIHGKSHIYKEIYKSVDDYMNNINYMNEKIKKLTGVDTRITRFPGGSSNTVSRFNPGIMTKLTKEVINHGYVYFDWNISSGDAGGTKNAIGIYNNVVNGLRYNRANVVLMHDLNSKTYTKEALKNIIIYGKENGYIFQKITDNTPMVTMKVNN